MTVILVLITFVGFLTIDYFMSRGKQPVIALQPAVTKQVVRPLEPSLVGGFKVPESLRYHPGHTWALSESPNLVRVGLDDFATKINGTIEKINLPQRGQWIRQGQKVWTLRRDGTSVDMLSPIEDSVADTNEA